MPRLRSLMSFQSGCEPELQSHRKAQLGEDPHSLWASIILAVALESLGFLPSRLPCRAACNMELASEQEDTRKHEDGNHVLLIT